MRLTSLAILVVLGACAPSASVVRSQNIQKARMEATQRPGPRQAKELAEAIHSAFIAGDYKGKPGVLAEDVQVAAMTIDRAVPHAGVDAPMLVGWKGNLLIYAERSEGIAELQRSFRMAPNEIAGRSLVMVYGAQNRQQDVAATCRATIAVINDSDDRLSLIASCRENMNAASNEGEMSWMSPELVAWYQAENARRLRHQVDIMNAQAERDRQERQAGREIEQCSLSCKENGLRCQNRCDGDRACENRCVKINHACVDRCESEYYEALGH
jgi:hypothetical protein